METSTEEVPRSGTRDRVATTARILDAVETILVRDGFHALGINSIAREAGVDKVLIYRYFGGLPELVREFVLTREVWPPQDEFLGGMELEKFRNKRVSDRLATVLIHGEKTLRDRPLTLALLNWELAPSAEIAAEFTKLREQEMTALAREVCEGSPATTDTEALFALLWSGMIYLTALGRAGGPVAGLRPQRKTDRSRIQSTMQKVIQKLLKGKRKK